MDAKIGRNEPCPCGRGKKYKHCHYGKALPPPKLLSLRNRNLIFMEAATDIFGSHAVELGLISKRLFPENKYENFMKFRRPSGIHIRQTGQILFQRPARPEASPMPENAHRRQTALTSVWGDRMQSHA